MNKNQHYRITRIFNAFLVTLFFASISTSILAAKPAQSGSIRGKVVADIPDQRKTLPGVVISLTGERLGEKKLQSVSDTEGQYDFPSLVAGEYILTVEFSGFKKYVCEEYLLGQAGCHIDLCNVDPTLPRCGTDPAQAKIMERS